MHNLLKNFYLKNDETQFKKDWLMQNWEVFYDKQIKYPKKIDIQEGFDSLDSLYDILKSRNWLQKPIKMKNGKSSVEYHFMFPYNGHDKYSFKIRGSIDLVLHIDGEYHIIDWKSGSDKNYHIEDLLKSDQLILYSAALQKTDEIQNETLHYVYFYSNKVCDFEVEDHHFKHLKTRINKIIDTYDSGTYTFNISEKCDFCNYRKCCEGMH
jgi:CRISPR/Cas system-associated exonuclease Cas4 (RecB family)